MSELVADELLIYHTVLVDLDVPELFGILHNLGDGLIFFQCSLALTLITGVTIWSQVATTQAFDTVLYHSS